MKDMTGARTYFFCGVGGSGMGPLAQICLGRGDRVLGSDRSYDQGKTPDKFKVLAGQGVELHPQDGSGVMAGMGIDALVVSGAVEETIPDVVAALAQNIPVIRRAELLAEMFNGAEIRIAVAGTSGKSTVTGMVATALCAGSFDPTVMNGGVIRNFESSMRVGAGGVFVSETDESDGSIALYEPDIAVLNNVALDHKALEELDALFGDFIARAGRAVVLNFDDDRVRALSDRAGALIFSYGIEDQNALLTARDIAFSPEGVSFTLYESDTEKQYSVRLAQPGAHNISNALACLCVCKALGMALEEAVAGLGSFTGIARRLEHVGSKNDITVIDDFAHNPDKIAASLKTLKEFDGRVIIMFQPHGFGPLKLTGTAIAESFAHHMGEYDVLFITEPFYAGGTVDRAVGAKDIAALVLAQGREALAVDSREEACVLIEQQAWPGDRIVIMGARDDSLSDFAREILGGL